MTKKYTAEELKLRTQYSNQRSMANRRRIDFILTYDQWKCIWIESGHLHEKGRKRGQYCMSRVNDKGAYELGNVFIQLHSKNAADGHRGIPDGPSKLKGLKKTVPSKLKGVPSGKKGIPWSEARRNAQNFRRIK